MSVLTCVMLRSMSHDSHHRDVSSTGVTALPESIGNCTSLQDLCVVYNPSFVATFALRVCVGVIIYAFVLVLDQCG